MGIRFYCPNGHKLNVKEQLAGKRGICPQCGVKLLIPRKSTRLSSREERSQQAGMSANSGGNPNDFEVFADDPSASIASLDEYGHSVPEAKPTPTQRFAQSSVVAPAPASAFDDPNVVWYVQFPDGQRYGPVTLPILQSWVRERRISPTMLVWREGWEDWLEARQVFPETEKLFQASQLKKLKNESNSKNRHFDDNRLDTGDDVHKFSVLMIAVIVLEFLIFGVVLYFIFRV
jgi:hypothetical protein